MSVQKIKIPRLPDRSIVDFFLKLGTLYKIKSIGINALGFASIGQVDLSSSEENEELQERFFEVPITSNCTNRLRKILETSNLLKKFSFDENTLDEELTKENQFVQSLTQVRKHFKIK